MGGMEEPVIEKLRELGVQTKALYASEAVSGVCESSRGVSKATQTANEHLIVKVKCNASIFTSYPSHTTLRRKKLCCMQKGHSKGM